MHIGRSKLRPYKAELNNRIARCSGDLRSPTTVADRRYNKRAPR